MPIVLKPLVRLVPVALCAGLALIAFGCSSEEGTRRGADTSEGSEEEKPPTAAQVEAAVKAGLGKSCKRDADCAMYLRCQKDACAMPPAMDGEGAVEPTPAVAIVADKGEAQFHVELARTAEERSRGLMFRPRMNDQWGMLFIYGDEAPHTFWMKNTYIPLDMVFISADHHVVGVVENAEPHTLSDRKVDGPSQYILEINAGLAKKYGIDAGDKVVFANLPK